MCCVDSFYRYFNNGDHGFNERGSSAQGRAGEGVVGTGHAPLRGFQLEKGTWAQRIKEHTRWQVSIFTTLISYDCL